MPISKSIGHTNGPGVTVRPLIMLGDHRWHMAALHQALEHQKALTRAA